MKTALAILVGILMTICAGQWYIMRSYHKLINQHETTLTQISGYLNQYVIPKVTPELLPKQAQ